ncbi:ABC transporter [Acidihalobacter yilgarnensis]|uniref:ABC transporter n=1 Tax=Acidihalobacter yilgarnensis TaxID=2819280 RepID=A0A1D8INW0_9GAMM|nr:ABC transporter ATP-binding protein [Acidihalobacter yilgarnensis]AOU98094.1 ABC transporter [Acidihalobacter yilgarnensis]
MTKALSIRNLRKVYAQDIVALKGIDLDVEEGDFFALLGPNGAGKSTTIGISSSLVNKTSGEVRIFDCDLDTQKSQAKTFIGLVPQEFNFNQFEPVEEVLINQAGYYGIDRSKARVRAERYLKQLGLWEKRRQMARNLSGGQKRRLMIARALVHEPRLLILDEPTAGVDIEIRRSMWAFLREINAQGTTIILTTHYLEEAENLCRNIAIIDHGEIVENTSMKQLLAKMIHETVVLDVATPLGTLPELAGYRLRGIDTLTLEAEITREHGLTELFSKLNEYGIRVTSMRNKSNRLEELFMALVGEGESANRRNVS